MITGAEDYIKWFHQVSAAQSPVPGPLTSLTGLMFWLKGWLHLASVMGVISDRGIKRSQPEKTWMH